MTRGLESHKDLRCIAAEVNDAMVKILKVVLRSGLGFQRGFSK